MYSYNADLNIKYILSKFSFNLSRILQSKETYIRSLSLAIYNDVLEREAPKRNVEEEDKVTISVHHKQFSYISMSDIRDS